ncbi:uncharacterized protein FQA47_009673 [Oryzias melastigma]|uniref:Cytohesin Ubiquitin Protein Inducing domain-containing protein n=1 Tax=Oryzias melastigma TaxID=30732 RepID=A0A834C2T9_ORYME|nr:uncharacterized protein FQA47_009673 [Oryzias melastigma]
MTTMESKEEISDTDSGIILQSGPDSPTSPVKDLSPHTRALKLKHQSLEDRLELCLLELRKLCIREAELTGKLPSEYPLTPEEKPPRVRRRIGASFKLDEGLMQKNQQDSELQALETDLALQQQIYVAARKLSLEDNLSKPQKKSRLLQCKREERKVKDLQEAVFQHRIKSECNSPCVSTSSSQNKDLCMSDDSSLSDVVALDDDVDSSSPLSPPVLNNSCSDPLQLSEKPLQSSPQPSRVDSPTGTPVTPESCRIPLTQFVRNSALRHNHTTSAPSTPELLVRRQYSQSFSRLLVLRTAVHGSRLFCTADFRVQSPESTLKDSDQSFSSHIGSPVRTEPTEIPKLCPPPYGFHFGAQKKNFPDPTKKTSQPLSSPGRRRTPLEDSQQSLQNLDTGVCSLSSSPVAQQIGATSPRRVLKPPPPYTRVVRTPSLKEYPNHAIRLMPREIVSEELKSWHQRNKLQKLWLNNGEKQASLSVTSPTSPHLPPFNQGSGNLILQRAPDGTPVQWFVAEDAEIVSQV